MRSEDEMLKLIIGAAANDDNVRAVEMNGSRVNPNAKKDPFQDYDVVYYVKSVKNFRSGFSPSSFGEMMIMQLPEDMGDPPQKTGEHYVYLMQFADGNRIDLGIRPLSMIDAIGRDSLSRILLDKDKLAGELPPPSDKSHLPSPPTEKSFDDCCNEFWWCCPYVAKGLWRKEMPYAKHMLETVVRKQLMRMLTWYAGDRFDYKRSAGKLGKYLKDQIGPELYEVLVSTYSDANTGNIWESLFNMGDLFRKTAQAVARNHRYRYPETEDRKVSAYLRKIRDLPGDATDI